MNRDWTRFGYCTNVHAGVTLADVKSNLIRHAKAVADTLGDDTLEVGLWLAADAARETREPGLAADFAAWLADHGLAVRTINGFPYGDFHRKVVKHAVYSPDWTDPLRVAYTRDLADVLAACLPADGMGTISTVPLGWSAGRGPVASPLTRHVWRTRAANGLRRIARELASRAAETGKTVRLAIEPEPGCELDTAADVVNFFERDLLGPIRAPDEADRIRRHIGVCHDVCHAAVMFESQRDVFRQYDAAGIGVFKIQLSAAIDAPFSTMSVDEAKAARVQLREFGEDRYLHQVAMRSRHDGPIAMVDDLPAALDALEAAPNAAGSDWRVHYHVPLHHRVFGALRGTQDALTECLEVVAERGAAHPADMPDIEVETYAWSVLPEGLRQRNLASGIADELAFARTAASTAQAAVDARATST